MTHIYVWGNNPKRATLKGRRCHILHTMVANSMLVEFENGQQEVVSRRSVRKIVERKPE